MAARIKMRRQLLTIPQGVAAYAAMTAFHLAEVKCVIIGGGAMFLWGLRSPLDVDILFDRCQSNGSGVFDRKGNLLVDIIEKDSWEKPVDFDGVYDRSIDIGDSRASIRVAVPEDLLVMKRLNFGRDKDIEDIRLLEDYLEHREAI